MHKSLRELGSATARGGFRTEDEVVQKFNNWKNDSDAQQWLQTMGYNLKEIEKVVAIKLHGYKTDVQVQVRIFMKSAISVENLSVKLVSNPRGYNQIDKRKVDDYKAMWNIPEDIARALKLFTGEIRLSARNLRDPRRMFLDEMGSETQRKIIDFFTRNKMLVIADILKGRGDFSAGWMLVILKVGRPRWTLKNINVAMNFFGDGEVEMTSQGSLRIGRITVQRKGGTPDPTKLQFKINPAELFNA